MTLDDTMFMCARLALLFGSICKVLGLGVCFKPHSRSMVLRYGSECDLQAGDTMCNEQDHYTKEHH